ncbi:uncharacterized protein LOC106661718 [Cimex lectularius]|uniref:DUF4780 domain-containing protein n=1 Tax=Cimex lectularius TaxID=79782 RepID=A0A8I6SI21_CIMLE|nr:uncharacterized protein LOC106661718 [Cimex lectularius]XP_024081667.1 uncharacterized protein LOC106661718 [Cimex lectularius]
MDRPKENKTLWEPAQEDPKKQLMKIEDGSRSSSTPINQKLENTLLVSPFDVGDFQEGMNTKPEDETTRMGETEKIDKQRLKPKKLSGAQKRKRAIERAKQKGEPVLKKIRKQNPPYVNFQTLAQGLTTKSVNPPKTRPMPTKSGKRDRSLDSVTSSGSAPWACSKKSKVEGSNVEQTFPPNIVGGEGNETYQQALKALKMAVVLEEYPDKELTADQGRAVQRAILAEVWRCKNSKGPQFRNGYVEKGAVLITCEKQSAKEWLMATVPTIHPWEGANLRVGPYREIIKPNRVAMWVPDPDLLGTTDTGTILGLMKSQNPGINTKQWRVVSQRVEGKGLILVVDIDNASFGALSKANLKLYLGFAMITLKVIKKAVD